MKFFKKAFYTAGSLFPTSLLKRIVPSSTLLPYHHLVSNDDVLHVKHLYPYKNVKQFTEDLDHLLKHMRPVSVDEVLLSLNQTKKLPGNSFLITFDDGFREVYDVIEPILTAKGIPAVFFINPAFVDNRELFYRGKISLVIEELQRKKTHHSVVKLCGEIIGAHATDNIEGVTGKIKQITNLNKDLLNRLAEILELSFEDYLEREKPFLTTAQLEMLARKGYSIGAHSWDHPYYHLISSEEQIRQTIDSCIYIQEKFSPGVVSFSFPHSDSKQPQRFFDRIMENDDRIDLFFGTQNQKIELDNKILHRFNAERPDLNMEKQLNGILILIAIRKLMGKDRVFRKKDD